MLSNKQEVLKSKPTVSLTNSTGITNLGDNSEEKDLDTARRRDGIMLLLAFKVSIVVVRGAAN